MINVRRLRILWEVARHGSITRAAQALAYTPSAVSQQIAVLEREVGVALLQRNSRGIVLTEPGRLLVTESEEIFSRLTNLESSLKALAGLNSGLLRLGWFATAGAHLVPLAVAAFRRRYPDVQLDLFQGDPDECEPRLQTRQLELALVYQFETDAPNRSKLAHIDLMDDPLHIGLPLNHPLAARSQVRLADLADARWIQGVRRGSTLDILPQACRAAGFEPTIALRTDDRTVVEGLVAAGLGVALVPLLTLPAVRPDIVVRPLDSPILFRRVMAALPSGRYQAPAATAMIAILRQVCADLLTDAGRRLDQHLPDSPGNSEADQGH